MSSLFTFWIIFIALSFAVVICDRKYCMLKDVSVAKPQPYSWSRVQLAWWSVIVLSAFITVLIKYGVAPTLNQSTVILIGISAATIATARAIDVSDLNDPNVVRHQDKEGSNFFLDIISDQNGASIHRFQTVVFNFVFGIYFITYVLNHLTLPEDQINSIMPDIATNNLILLGLSSATYAALKVTENKTETAKQKEAAEGIGVDAQSEDPAVG